MTTKIERFAPQVRKFLNACLEAEVCYTCLSKTLFISYNIRISWSTIRRHDIKRRAEIAQKFSKIPGLKYDKLLFPNQEEEE